MYYFYVAIFGGIGAISRYGISLLINAGGFPLNTFIINVTGCFFLAFVIRYVSTFPKVSDALLNGIGTGLIGAFTTFSAFSVETSALISSGAYGTAFFYVLISMGAGFASAGLGAFVGHRLIGGRELKRHEP